MDKKVKLIVGDYSGDGHEKTYTRVIESNLTSDQMIEAYKAACVIIGMDFCQDVCSEYEEMEPDEEEIATLAQVGISLDVDEFGWLSPEGFLDAYLQIVKLGNPNFIYGLVPEPKHFIPIGGYGLFY